MHPDLCVRYDEINLTALTVSVYRMEGFIVFDYAKEYPLARKELLQWLTEGKIKRKETVVNGGLAKAEGALIDLYKGINTGKLLVEVAQHESVDVKARL
jgi:NADPH-dependent curcumin reductase CurA